MPKISFDCTDDEYNLVLNVAIENERTVAAQLRYMIRKLQE